MAIVDKIKTNLAKPWLTITSGLGYGFSQRQNVEAQQGNAPKFDVDNSVNGVMATVLPLIRQTLEISSGSDNKDVEEFKYYAMERINHYYAINFGLSTDDGLVDRELVQMVSYALCTFIDELILNTTSGLNSSWLQNSLSVIYHQETTGGTEFFKKLRIMMKAPQKYIDVLSFYYVCLELGFMGQYRAIRGGNYEFANTKQQLLDVIISCQPYTGLHESPDKNNIESKKLKVFRNTPFWVIGVVFFTLGLLVYIGLNWSISIKTVWVRQQLVEYNISKPIYVAPYNVDKIQANNIGPINIAVDYHKILSELLAAEIRQGKVVIQDSLNEIIIRLSGNTAYATGSALLVAEAVLIVDKVAEFLARFDIAVEVRGYSDNIPVNTSVTVGNNYELSLRRANRVMKLLQDKALSPRRLSAIGLSDTQPIAPNSTTEGREKNRRVEIVLIK